MQDVTGFITRPIAELIGFQQITSEAGASTAVQFELGSRDLEFTDNQLFKAAEPVGFNVWIEQNKAEGLQTNFYLKH